MTARKTRTLSVFFCRVIEIQLILIELQLIIDAIILQFFGKIICILPINAWCVKMFPKKS